MSSEFRILLVEDEKNADDLMKELLLGIHTSKFHGKESSKPVVTVARNQIEVENAVESTVPAESFDLIILDLQYPGKDGQIDKDNLEGMKCLPWLRERQPRAAIAIQTAYAYGDDMESAVAALADERADEFIPKGLNWQATEPRLAAAWDRARERRQAKFVARGYIDLHTSRIYRALAEDARDAVYRRSSGFTKVADQLENAGSTSAAMALRAESDDLINEITEITSPVDDPGEQDLDEVDAASFLEDLQLFHSRQCRPGIKIGVEHAEGRVHTYERDLRSALHELVENAIETFDKVTPRSDGRIKLSARPTIAARAGLEIKILDNGPGILEEFLKPPFKRGRSSKEKRGKPFRGMGLHVAQRFVNRIFGSVTLANRTSPDHGAEVTVFVPDLAVSPAGKE